MSRTNRGGPALLAAAVALGAAALLPAGAGEKSGGPGGAWKPFLPAAAYKALAERSIKTIEEQAKVGGADGLERAQAEAAILAGYVQAAEGGAAGEAAALGHAAAELARQADPKEGQLTDLAGRLRNPKANPAGGSKVLDGKLGDLMALMNLFRNKNKGGEGTAPELQYTAKLKNQNGSEALIGALAGKKMTPANLEKAARELELYGYRVAVLGALTHDHAPEQKVKKGEPARWRELSIVMRDAGVALAEAAHKKDVGSVHTAANKLSGSCTECHSAFR